MKRFIEAIALFFAAVAVYAAAYMAMSPLVKQDDTVRTVQFAETVTRAQDTMPPRTVYMAIDTMAVEAPAPTTTTTEAPKAAYTDEDAEALAIIVYQEAGSDTCSDELRLMVANVVMNRVADDRFPNTVCDVALQPYQYGRLYWTSLAWPERAQNACEAHAVERARDIARRVLNGERVLPSDVVYQAEFPQGRETVYELGGFYFCR